MIKFKILQNHQPYTGRVKFSSMSNFQTPVRNFQISCYFYQKTTKAAELLESQKSQKGGFLKIPD